MSTVKAASFQHPSSTEVNLALAADGTVSGGLPVANRNLLYNGAMQVAQRGTSTAGITTTGYYTADRWQFGVTAGAMGTWTQSVVSEGPTGSGFTKSFKMLCTTAQASPAASSQMYISQKLEGQDVQRIAKGTASAQQLTLSFWVRSNVTGTFAVMLYDSDNGRSISDNYTVNVSGAWESKTVTFSADTSGTLSNDNGLSLTLYFALAAGSDFTSGTTGSWASYADANWMPGQTNLAAVNNYWQVTGVQLETGPVATEFEHRSFGDELARCQRYYQKFGGSVSNECLFVGTCTTASSAQIVPTYASMRAIPTFEHSGTVSHFRCLLPGIIGNDVSGFTWSSAGTNSGILELSFSSSASYSSGKAVFFTANDASLPWVAFSAEL